MSIESEIFSRRVFKFEKLEKAGWKREKDGDWSLARDFLGGKFTARLRMSAEGVVRGEVVDNAFGEEYLPLREESPGSFALEVRNAYEALLEDVAKECSIPRPFGSAQANRISNLIFERFGASPDFPWEDLSEYGVFRVKEGGKWFALIGNVAGAKLDSNLKGEIWILNLKLDPAQITELTSQGGFYRAYHMNKIHWLTIALNETVSDETIMDLLAKSRALVAEKRKN